MKIFVEEKKHDIWIDETMLVHEFIEDVVEKYVFDKYYYDHFLFDVQSNIFLDPDKNFRENKVLSGDLLILG